MKNSKQKEYLRNVLPCIYYGLICGSSTGFLIFVFKYLSKKAEMLSSCLYDFGKNSPVYGVLIVVLFTVLGIMMAFLHKKAPEIKGGGIPRSEGVIRGVITMRPLRTLVGTFFGSMLSFLCGVPVGSEGPSVLMGTSLGSIFTHPKRNDIPWKRYIMTGGAGAGFAVATGSPLSGIIFALEEIHKRFTPMIVLMVSVSVVTATCVNELLCSVSGISSTLFEFEILPEFTLNHIVYLLITGLLTALAVGGFDASIYYFSRLTSNVKKRISSYVRIGFVFAITGVLGFFVTDAVYSGHHLIEHILTENRSVMYLLLILALRLVMMLLVTDNGVTGGIFIPTLALGAVVGALISKLLIALGMPTEYFSVVVLLSMCAFIGGTLRAPLTAAVFFLEVTSQYSNLFYVSIVVFTVYAITSLLNQTPFYDRALEFMEEEQNRGKEAVISYFEMKVSHNSFVVGKTVRDILWPSSSVVISVKRADESKEDMDHDGEKKLYPEDTVVVRSKYYDENELRELFVCLVGNDYEIIKKEYR